MMQKNLYTFLILLVYIAISFSIKYFGIGLPFINDSQMKYCTQSYEKIAKKVKQSNIAGIVIKTIPKLDIIPVGKKIIGAIMKNKEIFFIDSEGNLFQSNSENYKDYITVTGDHQYWHLYYQELEKYPEILQKTYHVHIYHYRIDIYLLPGILIKLNRSIKDLSEFHYTYPMLFNKTNYYIDLRNPKRVGHGNSIIHPETDNKHSNKNLESASLEELSSKNKKDMIIIK